MALFDMPLEQLRGYTPERDEPDDFDAFWSQTLEQTRAHRLETRWEPIDAGLRTVEVFDGTFSGWEGQPVKAWLLLPRQRAERLPCVVEYIGYGGGRDFPTERLLWSACGYANLVMDTRGQGASWSRGDTPDPDPYGTNQQPGFMTRGIEAPHQYYYRRVFADGVRAVEAARSHPDVDPERVAVAGGSQGGGITIAVAGLLPDVAAALPDVPFLCHYRRATEISDSFPFHEISRYLTIYRDRVDSVFETLSYFDGVNFSARAASPALFSAGLMDMTCPPSTVFAAYNHWRGPKDMRVYHYNQHEGGGSAHTQEKIRFLGDLWGL